MARSANEGTAAPLIPPTTSLSRVRGAARECRACPLWRPATQTVFGEGPKKARLFFIGEQPGDQEDLAGHPFVGPAGRLFDRALQQASIDRELVYVTNVVKHFKFEQRGKKRIHKKPNSLEISACLPWLQKELSLVNPELIVCLGATAAQSLFGTSFKVTQRRGEVLTETGWAPLVVATVHPSSLLRAPDEETRRKETARFIADLRAARELLESRH